MRSVSSVDAEPFHPPAVFDRSGSEFGMFLFVCGFVIDGAIF